MSALLACLLFRCSTAIDKAIQQAEEAAEEEGLIGDDPGRGERRNGRTGRDGGGALSLAEQDDTPADNPETEGGFALGRMLSYEKALSQNTTPSCDTCHIQELDFTDNNVLSAGFAGELTSRNSMGLANAKYYANDRFFWDERAEIREEQVLMPIQDDKEMGLTLEEAVARIAVDDVYPPLFQQAFGSETINSELMARAMAQFIRSLESFDSRFDEGR